MKKLFYTILSLFALTVTAAHAQPYLASDSQDIVPAGVQYYTASAPMFENPDPPKNAFMIAPLTVLFGNASCGYERGLNNYLSVGCDLGLVLSNYAGWFPTILGGQGNTHIYSGVKLSPKVRFYPFSGKTAGFYTEAQVSAGKHEMTIEYGTGHPTSADYVRLLKRVNFIAKGGGVFIGYKKTFGSGFTIDSGFGIQSYNVPGNLQSSFVDIDQNGIKRNKTYGSQDLDSIWYGFGAGSPAVFRFDLGYAF
ncbi:MAG: hypothetical protein V4543_11555 [Bacteroidota bacterium]